LFWKVLALVLATAVIATISIGVYFQYALRDNYNGFLKEQIGSYMRMVVDDIGAPPDTTIAKRIATHYPIDIRLEGPSMRWSSAASVPSRSIILTQTRPSIFDRGDSLLFRGFDDRLFGVVTKGDWNYIVRLRSAPSEGLLAPATVMLGIVLMTLFFGAYRIVQRFLRPVPELMKGVESVASEEFDHQVPVVSNDELGELTKAFNAMSQRVAAIIASKRRLLFDVSHELRSPLTRMNVALAMLPDGKAKISIERNIRELNTMITELLENERLAVLGGTLVVEAVDVVALVQKVTESFGYDIKRIEVDSLTSSLEIMADGQRLTVALRNVISNALKYSAESNGPVKVTVFPDDNGARVVVADTGIGISPEAQAMVFEPFYRTDDSRSRATGGYGLGLSLTKSIVDAHGGVIQLSSTPGCGTTVMLWLPGAPTAGKLVRTVAGSMKQTAGA
jgi:signal transduction histidine kinase